MVLKVISQQDIIDLNIKSEQVVTWVREAFLAKSNSSLPAKISQTFENGANFFNTMPAIMFDENVYGVKVVSRYPDRNPAIKADIFLYDLKTGEFLATLDGTWITAARTGAVAALTVEELAVPNYESIAVMGLGATGNSFLKAWLSYSANKSKNVKLLNYKNQAVTTKEMLLQAGVAHVEICNDYESLIKNSDVVVSAITVANDLIGKDEWFKPGVLVVPIHTRGFQNCDLFFEQVICDDTSHVAGFKNFEAFKSLKEISDVLSKKAQGRVNKEERILAYNIGIALHDVLVAKRVWEMQTKH